MSGSASPAPIQGSKTSTLRKMYRGAYAPVVPLRPGAMVGGAYRVGGMLGQGGMGAVYQAVNVESDELVALKVMRSEHAADASMAERFEREALMAQRVKNPFVSGVRDFGRSEDGTMYLVMELLRGKSLATHLEEQMVLPWREGARIARDIARGLAAVHAAGVLHRDLKPDNVFLCADGQVKLLDFGIAKEYAPGWEKGAIKGKALTQAGTVLGTPLYMSPEAVTQSPCGPPTDLYALGALLFEMITGRLLFEEEEAVVLMGMHLRVKPDRVSAVRSDLGIPRELDALVDRLLAKEPSKRPASAAEVADQLDALSKTVPHTGGTGPFPAVSALEHRRAVAAVPTAITSHPDASVEDPLADTTIPRGPLPSVISVPLRQTFEEEDEPATILERLSDLPSTDAAPSNAAPAVVGADTTPNRALATQRVLLVALPVAVVGLTLFLWATTRPPEPVVPPVSAIPHADVRPEVVTPVPPPEVPAGETLPSEVTIRFELLPASATVSENGAVIPTGELRISRDGREHEFRIEARGRIPQSVSVIADQDRTVRVELARRRDTAGAGGTSGGGTGGGTTGGGGDIVRTF